MPNPLETLAKEISTLEERLAEKRRELIALVSGTAPARRAAPATNSNALPVSDMARRALAKAGPEGLPFAQLWERVNAQGGSKFALKSFLNKARERDEVKFVEGKDGRGNKYVLADLKSRSEPDAPKPEAPAKPAAAPKAVSVRKKAKSPTGNASGANGNGKGVTLQEQPPLF